MWTERRSGNNNQRKEGDHRSPYERDRTRVIHCPAFRRLQRKTQILGTDEGDFHRTRLTHSLEVASIGRSIVRNLVDFMQKPDLIGILPDDDLISVICLLHDIGHPPFGHGGEVALNYMMRENGGFEGNAQTLRLLTKIENSYGEYGLDLTRRSLLGVLKYPVCFDNLNATEAPAKKESLAKTLRINDWLPPKGYYSSESALIEWLLAPFNNFDRELFQSLQIKPTEHNHGKAKYQTFDCSIMNIADDIAYGVHDLEDAIHLRLILRDLLDNSDFSRLFSASGITIKYEAFMNDLFSDQIYIRKRAIGELVNYFITHTEIVETSPGFDNKILKFNLSLHEQAFNLLSYLKDFIYDNVIDSQESRTFEYGGQTVVSRLFEAFSSNPLSLLDVKNRKLYQETTDESSAKRVIADYVANMTDEYAYRMHERLFGFNTRTIFERL